MTHRYKVRTGIVEVLRRDVALAKQVTDNLVLTQQGFESTDADPHEFTDLFGEPMPNHLRIAVHLETDLWVALHTTLDGVRNAGLSREEYARLVPRLRRELGTLQELLDLEKEILYSPLSNHFLDRLVAIKRVRA